MDLISKKMIKIIFLLAPFVHEKETNMLDQFKKQFFRYFNPIADFRRRHLQR